MELKLNLGMETLINLFVFLQNLELETVALIIVAGFMAPVILFSLWDLAFSVVYQLFWLGVKAGVVLGWVGSGYLAYFKLYAKWYPKGPAEAPAVKCTMVDVLLSILFQAGAKFPAGIWDGLVTTLVPSSAEEKVERKKKMVTFSGLETSKPVEAEIQEMKVEDMETFIEDGSEFGDDPLLLHFNGLDNLDCVSTPVSSTSSVTTRSSARRQSRGGTKKGMRSRSKK